MTRELKPMTKDGTGIACELPFKACRRSPAPCRRSASMPSPCMRNRYAPEV
jgi:hypothetical protein